MLEAAFSRTEQSMCTVVPLPDLCMKCVCRPESSDARMRLGTPIAQRTEHEARLGLQAIIPKSGSPR